MGADTSEGNFFKLIEARADGGEETIPFAVSCASRFHSLLYLVLVIILIL